MGVIMEKMREFVTYCGTYEMTFGDKASAIDCAKKLSERFGYESAIIIDKYTYNNGVAVVNAIYQINWVIDDIFEIGKLGADIKNLILI